MADFPASSMGRQQLTAIDSSIRILDGAAAIQTSAAGARQEGSRTKATLRDVLHDRMEAMSRTARALALDTPGLDNKFRMPRSAGDQVLLNTARAFALDAVEHEQALKDHGLPATFISDLNAEIAAFGAATDEQATSLEKRGAATATLEDASDDGIKAMNIFDAIVRNIYRDNPAVLAEWTIASHVERAPKHKTAGTKSPPEKS